MGARDGEVFIFLGFCLSAQFVTSLNLTCNYNDLIALEGFLQELESGIDGWSSNSSNCYSWEGVTCEYSGLVGKDGTIAARVVSLELGSKRLRGRLSKSLAGLDQVRTLNLSKNFLSDSLPAELFNLKDLEVLDLSSNDLSGLLSLDINLPSLTFCDMSANKFSGPIDAVICRTAKRIQVLNLSMNEYTGEIPEGFGNCSSLEHLSLGSNFISGSLPEDFFGLPKLSQLELQNNMLSGPLSLGFGNLSSLVKLDISFNEFSGTLPDFFQNLGQLRQLSANSNKFTGHLPASLSNSPTISSLSLNNNSLNGTINVNCSAMIQLISIDLGSNRFEGPIPDDLYSCQKLSAVNFARNNLDSQVPDSFKNFKSLSYLSLSNNSLHNISAALGILQHCKNLTGLVLSLNFHDEVMPADWNLEFEGLNTLVIANCQLTGSIPPWLSSCTKLQLLDLSWNHLSGTIPFWLGKFGSLFYLDLSNNSLYGNIPRSLTELQNLIHQNISLEEPSLDFPFFSKKNQTANEFLYKTIWSFPPSLDLCHNMLTGPIWPEFGNLKNLHVLNLKNNYLSGHIPSTVSGMTNLETLDLSYNNLSGTIPPSLVSLSFLSKFSVAYNQLSGRIPSGGQFLTFPDSSFEGNKGLCMLLFSTCPVDSPQGLRKILPESTKNTDGSILGLPFVIGAIAAFILTVIICFISGWVFPKAETRTGRRANKRRRWLPHSYFCCPQQ